MIEKDFKDLLLEIEMPGQERKDNINKVNLLIDTVKGNISKNVRLVTIELGGSYKKQTFINGEKGIDILTVISPKNKKLPADILISVNMNEIENALIYNLKNSMLFTNESKVINITRDYEKGSINFTLDDKMQYNFLIRLKMDDLIKEADDLQVEVLNYELYLRQLSFISVLNKEYPKFTHTIKILKYYKSQLNIKIISSYLLEILLCYGLEKYFYGNNYSDYIKSFAYALEDFIKEEKIEISNNKYQQIGTKKTMTVKDRYTIIDVTTPIHNLTKGITDINDFRRFKSFLVEKLPKDINLLSINVTPSWIIEGRLIEWRFVIEGTEQKNSGGEYEYNQDNNDMAILRSTLKALQFVVKNKLGINIVIKSNNPDLFLLEKHTDENASRMANIKSFIKENDLQVSYEMQI